MYVIVLFKELNFIESLEFAGINFIESLQGYVSLIDGLAFAYHDKLEIYGSEPSLASILQLLVVSKINIHLLSCS